MLIPVLMGIVFIPMIAEAVRSSRNERELRAAGATETPGDVYGAMQVIYPSCFVAMIVEASLRRRGTSARAIGGMFLFGAAKALKYWAISTLGVRWTFRVLVPPGSRRTLEGPYKRMRHPNYVAVIGELAGVALAAGAPIAGAGSVVIFSLLLRRRIDVEERALGLRT
jgi:methyltransferase